MTIKSYYKELDKLQSDGMFLTPKELMKLAKKHLIKLKSP